MRGRGRLLGVPRFRSNGPLIISPTDDQAPDVNPEEVEDTNSLKDDAISEMEAEAYLKEPSSSEQMFINYISEMASHIGMTKEEFARSPQARNYARKLGIEEDVYELS